MNRFESPRDELDQPEPERADPLRQVLAGLSFPQTPPGLVQKTRRRLQARQLRRRAAVGAGAVLMLIIGGLCWQFFDNTAKPVVTTKASPVGGAHEPIPASGLDDGTLEALFAPPPVASLAALNRRLDAAEQVLTAQDRQREQLQ